ncbi:ABC-2 type transport system permease protein [Propionicimonas paludicola]|uniref:ABC-2 type transport system permease protein n=1 Tax=Propionicimonas paludicola TaxID=185243 RepID=A0A2A9CNQ3_9ACTN|nr:ABC transporter permease [Propionicimonas paludicola]PFG16023.1 ABC-2 type transport system permease protein [Propionicimonas paludicola]
MRASLDRIAAIVIKEFRHLGRDPRALLAVVITPVIQLLLFAYAISFDVDHVPTIVVDLDRTTQSRDYLRLYEGSTFFTVVSEADTMDAVDQAFDLNQAHLAIVIEAGFGRQLASGGTGQVAVLVDGSEPTSARISQAYTVAANQLYNQQLTRQWAQAQGLDLSSLGGLEPRVRTWYNPERRSSDFLIPGLMVVIIAIVTVQQTAVTLVRERDLGTEEQLDVSPLRKVELMVAKLLPWTAIAFLDVAVIICLGQWLFDVPLRGDIGALAVGSALFVFAALGLGLLVSAIAPTTDTANILALLIAFLPSFLLSGLAFALDQIPVVLQWLSYAFPARYMVTISRVVFLKGGGFAEVWPELLALAGYATVMILVSSALHGRRARR